MTNSMDETTLKSNTPPKKKGIIRLKIVVPLIVFLGIILIYFTLFFDGNLRRGIEVAGGKIYGAEVNVAKIKTGFFRGSFLLQGLQITDKENPAQNIIQVGNISFKFLWSALLRAKFVINEAVVTNIQAYVPRKKPGKIYIEKEKKESESTAEDEEKKSAKKDPMEGLSEILAGFDPGSQLRNLKGELKADKKIASLQNELDGKQKEWKEKIAALPKSEEMQALTQRAKKIKIPKNPLKAGKALKELKSIIKEGKNKVSTFKNGSKSVKEDIKRFKNISKEIDKIADQDLKDIQKKMKIPDIDNIDFSSQLFSKILKVDGKKLKKYFRMARKHLKSKKKGEKKKVKKKKSIFAKSRKGKNYRFPITTGYPRFWLKKSIISSEPGESPYSGKIRGKAIDITSSPATIKKPAIIKLDGDFSKQNISGVNVKMILDHTGEIPADNFNANVASYPVSQKMISDGPKVKFGLNKAQGQLSANALIKGENLKIEIKNLFKNVSYLIDTPSKVLKEILTRATSSIPVIVIDAKATGTLDDIKWKIKSNLGNELNKGIKAQVKAKIEGTQKEIKNYIQNRIKGKKDKLMKNIDSVQSNLFSKLDKDEDKLKNAQGELAGQEKKGSSSSKSKKKKLKKIFKSFGF